MHNHSLHYMTAPRSRANSLLLLCFSWLVGCTNTVLNPACDLTGARKLSALSSRTVQLIVHAPESPHALGHQFLLVGIPFGSVSLEDPARTVFERAYQELALRGWRIRESDSAPATLDLWVKELEATAYDLIVTRSLRAVAVLSLHVHGPDGRTIKSCETADRASEYARFGFAPQLTHVLERAIDKALVSAFDCAAIRGRR